MSKSPVGESDATSYENDAALYCLGCGFDLRGHIAGEPKFIVCPECGQANRLWGLLLNASKHLIGWREVARNIAAIALIVLIMASCLMGCAQGFRRDIDAMYRAMVVVVPSIVVAALLSRGTAQALATRVFFSYNRLGKPGPWSRACILLGLLVVEVVLAYLYMLLATILIAVLT